MGCGGGGYRKNDRKMKILLCGGNGQKKYLTMITKQRKHQVRLTTIEEEKLTPAPLQPTSAAVLPQVPCNQC